MRTSCSIESSVASLALEMLCFLMLNQDAQIVEVALAVIAPRSSEDILDVGVLSLLLAHCDNHNSASLGKVDG